MTDSQEYTPNGLKLEGIYENDRNGRSADLFKCIIREVYGVQDVIIAHHLVYEAEKGDYHIAEEIPSADTLIFDHDVAKKLWGSDFKSVLVKLAMEPVETRDQLLSQLYYGRQKAAA